MKKRFCVIILSILLVLSMFSMISMAESKEGLVDDEVLKILYENSENPESWLEFINQNAEDDLGKWLPVLLKKIAASSTEHSKSLADVHYKTVTEAFDWGPAITKVVLDFGVPIDETTLLTSTFEVKSVRNYKEYNFETKSFSKVGIDHEVPREILKVYTSDNSGNQMTKGAYVTIEMAVGPTKIEGSPFNYNLAISRNEYVETNYRIRLNQDANLKSIEGAQLEMIPTYKKENSGDLKLIADDFINNQEFAYGDIKLRYASYRPDRASKEKSKNPLIIWLHGAGEGGTDTTIPLIGNKVVNLASRKIQNLFGMTGAYILVPQAPTMWMDYDGTGLYNDRVATSNGTSYYQEALKALIDKYVSENPEIDKNRVYIGGCSNGGYMTVNMIINYPDYFAAAYPVCEAYSLEWLTDAKIDAIKDMPIWLTHALSDGVVPIAEGEINQAYNINVEHDKKGDPILKDAFTNALYTRLVDKGAQNVHYSRFDRVVDMTGEYKMANGEDPYEYMGHFSWIYALNNECKDTIEGKEVTLFEWLADQSK